MAACVIKTLNKKQNKTGAQTIGSCLLNEILKKDTSTKKDETNRDRWSVSHCSQHVEKTYFYAPIQMFTRM